MIVVAQPGDLNWVNLYRVACQGEALELGDELLAAVDKGYAGFVRLIEAGTPCYGVTTGLGKLVATDLDESARAGLQANLLRARAVAIGEPLPRPVARAMLFFRLVNLLSGRSGVRSDLCRYLVARLNDDFVPWVPTLGHGMAGDAIANTHAFQTLLGEGFVLGPDGCRQSAAQALRARSADPFLLAGREGLALINGVCAAPAMAMQAFYRLEQLLSLANLVAAVSMEGLATPRDAVDPAVAECSSERGIGRVVTALRKHLEHSRIEVRGLQAPVSYRVIPQVHGALSDALAGLRRRIENCLTDFSDNPMQVGERLLSVGSFHNQHLTNQTEQVALALAHLACLGERRLHRLLNAEHTGLAPQLAARPGLDAGLVVTHKACIDYCARLRLLAQPVSLHTGETSGGQEDYMALAIPALARLDEMDRLTRMLLASELLAGIVAVRQRKQAPGDGVAALLSYFDGLVDSFECDRSPAADIETLLDHFQSEAFTALTS